MCVLDITETCKSRTLQAEAEQQQKCYWRVKPKNRQKAFANHVARYRSVRVPHFGTANELALDLMRPRNRPSDPFCL